MTLNELSNASGHTYEKCNNRLMVIDLQGVEYQLCDPEIATQTIVEEKLDK